VSIRLQNPGRVAELEAELYEARKALAPLVSAGHLPYEAALEWYDLKRLGHLKTSEDALEAAAAAANDPSSPDTSAASGPLARGGAEAAFAESERGNAAEALKRHEIVRRWETLIVARVPLSAMRGALGKETPNYDAAKNAFEAWEETWTNSGRRALWVPNHPDPRIRAAWELRSVAMPLLIAHSDPVKFFTEYVSIDVSEGVRLEPRALGRALHTWGFGLLLHPVVRASFDAAAASPLELGEILAVAERRTRYPRDGSPPGKPKNRPRQIQSMVPRIGELIDLFGSRNLQGRWNLLQKFGVDLSAFKRLPTTEGCALAVASKESNRSIATLRMEWKRRPNETLK
jgi:hypothetical protein